MAEPQSVEDGITCSTLTLLREGGPRSATIEAVAAHSGVAKTTIYRRYRDRRHMLIAALSGLTSPAPPDSAGRQDGEDVCAQRLRWLIDRAVAAVDHGIGFGGYASLLTEDDPEFSELFRRLVIEHRARLIDVVTACRTDGTLRADIDPETLIDAIVGIYVSERARTGTILEGWQDRIFALLWPATRPL